MNLLKNFFYRYIAPALFVLSCTQDKAIDASANAVARLDLDYQNREVMSFKKDFGDMKRTYYSQNHVATCRAEQEFGTDLMNLETTHMWVDKYDDSTLVKVFTNQNVIILDDAGREGGHPLRDVVYGNHFDSKYEGDYNTDTISVAELYKQYFGRQLD